MNSGVEVLLLSNFTVRRLVLEAPVHIEVERVVSDQMDGPSGLLLGSEHLGSKVRVPSIVLGQTTVFTA